MKKAVLVFIAGLCWCSLSFAAQFSGVIEKRGVPPELWLTVDGKNYEISENALIKVTGIVPLSPADLRKGMSIIYRVGNAPGSVGKIDSINVTGPSSELEEFLNN